MLGRVSRTGAVLRVTASGSLRTTAVLRSLPGAASLVAAPSREREETSAVLPLPFLSENKRFQGFHTFTGAEMAPVKPVREPACSEDGMGIN